jgi:hypothetical protein
MRRLLGGRFAMLVGELAAVRLEAPLTAPAPHARHEQREQDQQDHGPGDDRDDRSSRHGDPPSSWVRAHSYPRSGI